jgi:hypothetical protein
MPISVRQHWVPKRCILNLGLECRGKKNSQNILSKEFLVPDEEWIDHKNKAKLSKVGPSSMQQFGSPTSALFSECHQWL